MSHLTRRQMLSAIAQIAAATSLVSCGAGTEESSINSAVAVEEASDLEILASIAFDLFPHETLTPDLYIKVAESALAMNDPVVASGLANINALVDGTSWLNLQEDQRVEILSSIQESDFFALMKSATINVLYKDPVGIEFVGYGGSAIEFGGYLNRGFDDISWLPEQEAE